MRWSVVAALLLAALTISVLCYYYQDNSIPSISIISRGQWHARSPTAITKFNASNLPVPYVVVMQSIVASDTHCAGTQCADAVRRYQSDHMDDRRWHDIGYNFLIAPTGDIYEGRGWDVEGAQFREHKTPCYSSSINMGICIIGDYTDEAPSEKALQSLKALIQFGVDSNHVKSNYKLIGRTTNGCLPKKLHDVIRTWPHWRHILPYT